MDVPREVEGGGRSRRWALAALAAAALVAVGVSARRSAAPAVDRADVWVATVRRGTFRVGVAAHGALEPATSRWLAAPWPARVERVAAAAGTPVEPDDVVVVLADPELEGALEEARLRLAAERAALLEARARVERERFDQEAAVARAEAALEKARMGLEADRELRAKGLLPEIALRRAELDVAQLERDLELERRRLEVVRRTGAARLEELEARVGELASAAERARRRVEALHVRAGIAGMVQRVLVEPGQRVEAGARLARVGGAGPMVARLRVAQRDAARVAPGQRVELDVAGVPVEARVTRVEPTVVEGFVEVEAALPEELPAGARPDLAVEGEIVLAEVAEATFVDRPAGAAPGAELELFRLEDGGTVAERVAVRLGRVSARYAEVISGLRPGDRVIVSEPGAWRGAARIRLVER